MLFRLSWSRALGLGLVALLTSPAMGQSPMTPQPQPAAVQPAVPVVKPRELDLTKTIRIEHPAKAIVAATLPLPPDIPAQPKPTIVERTRVVASQAAQAGAPRRIVEYKTGVVESVGEEFLANSAPAPAKPADPKENPKVKPGEVKWHASFAAACEAARNSHKQVLLLHMMGDLDKQFC